MPWTKLDDQFHTHRKVRRVWGRGGRALGLHVMAMTYSIRNDLDGFVDPEWVTEQIPEKREREQVLRVLVDEGLWDVFGDGWEIHDFLEYNPSAAETAHRREMRRIAGKLGAKAKWQTAKPNGRHGD